MDRGGVTVLDGWVGEVSTARNRDQNRRVHQRNNQGVFMAKANKRINGYVIRTKNKSPPATRVGSVPRSIYKNGNFLWASCPPAPPPCLAPVQ